jgi:penicillin-binding protein 1A
MRNYLYSLIILLFLATAVACGALFALFHNALIDFAPLEQYRPGTPSVLLDDAGNEWARFELDKRKPIELDSLPQHLIDAFIAAEDWQFFYHPGISCKGIVRSMMINVYHGRRVQGASTITQQLVKLLFFDARKTFSRKIKEQLYALIIERQFTKQQILQAYLNHIYFGCGIYGVEAASQRFWNKPAAQLTVDESAMLAAVVKSPGLYCPLLCPLSGERRRNVVLNSMHKCGFISRETYAEAKKTPLTLIDADRNQCAPHLKETLRQLLEERFGSDQLYRGGLVIQTTINVHAQKEAERIFNAQCIKLRTKLVPDIDGGLIAMESNTGAIKAMVGGFDFVTSKFNRALQARRQIGSTIKPLIYVAALQQGKSFADTMIDEPFELIEPNGTVWRPNNYNNRFIGEETLAYALSHSNNIVTIKLLLEIGAASVIELAKKSHLPGPFHSYPSLALGTIDATLVDVAGMFNLFANNGTYVEPHFIRWVKDAWGTKIYKKEVAQEPVIDQRTISQVTQVLKHGLERTKKKSFPEAWIAGEGICKTGTTNDSRTCWFIGSTPELTTAVYIGCDDNRSLGQDVFPLRTAFPIWLNFNCAVPSTTRLRFTYDPSLREYCMDEKTGQRVYDLHNSDAVTILV